MLLNLFSFNKFNNCRCLISLIVIISLIIKNLLVPDVHDSDSVVPGSPDTGDHALLQPGQCHHVTGLRSVVR